MYEVAAILALTVLLMSIIAHGFNAKPSAARLAAAERCASRGGAS
jgi:hypothetical protein